MKSIDLFSGTMLITIDTHQNQESDNSQNHNLDNVQRWNVVASLFTEY